MRRRSKEVQEKVLKIQNCERCLQTPNLAWNIQFNSVPLDDFMRKWIETKIYEIMAIIYKANEFVSEYLIPEEVVNNEGSGCETCNEVAELVETEPSTQKITEGEMQ